jgi:hypothetical protein
LGCIVEHRQDHIHFWYDLSNNTTLTQEIVVSSIFSVTEIITIEDHLRHLSPCRIWVTKPITDNE